jgi:hypothetical protein
VRPKRHNGVVQLEAIIVVGRETTQTLQVPEGIMISASSDFKHRNESPGTNLGGLLDIAIEIAARRRDILRRMRIALENRNDLEALDYARQLCGVDL